MRLKLMMGILAMAVLLVGTVTLFSPYAPVVGPVMEIEDIWAIEDERKESEKPLVTRLENHGQALGYDALSDTFYCTLGMEQAGDWPDIHLTAPGATGVTLCFADDYSYDWCRDAIVEGVAYQVLTYTEEEFWYTQVVFTGLPIVCLQTDSPIDDEEQLGHAAISGFGFDPIQAEARIRLRGAGTRHAFKPGYKIEFTGNHRRGQGGYPVPGIGVEHEIALLSMMHDETLMRDKLSWDVYAELSEENTPFAARKTQHAELFINDEYYGIFLMINLMDGERELALAGESHLNHDSVYRAAFIPFRQGRMLMEDPLMQENGFGYELRYTTKTGNEFADLQPYLELLTEEDDEVFAARALEMVDIDQLLRYVLYVQACGMTDNFLNNMYIWAEKTQTGMRYTFYPWDLDLSWRTDEGDSRDMNRQWIHYPFADRMINLDVGGARSRLASIWQEMKERVFTQDTIAGLLDGYAIELAESGAMLRNEARWNAGVPYPVTYELLDMSGVRFATMDEIVDLIAGTEERLPFLEESGSETANKQTPDQEMDAKQETAEEGF